MRPLLLTLLLVPFLAAQEPFRSTHQREWEYYRDNPNAAAARVFKAAPKRPDLEKVQSMTKVVYGFHPYWQNGSESNYYLSMLTHIAYFSADINASTGAFNSTNSWASANVVTLAKQYGVKVHLCLTLFSGHATLLASTTAKNTLIANTLAQLAVRGADGVNIDFEGVSSTVKTEFRTFMRQFGDSLKAHGYEFVIELPAVDWSNVFDATFFSTTGPVTDYYFAMLYDYWWSGSSTAGPNSPLRSSTVTSEWHVLRSINTYITTKGCPAQKFIAGFPSYGREWAVTSPSANAATMADSTSYSRTYTVVKNDYIDTIPLSRQFWSSTYNTRYYNSVRHNAWRQTWYDDSLSWGMKFDSIKVKNVAGTGMWALGYDGTEPELWGALKTAFASVPDPLHTSFDVFESGTGRFNLYPAYSGSTSGIKKAASTQAVTNDAANNGWQSLQIVLKDSTEISTNWSVRILSGSGSRSNNVQFPPAGYLGFWMKTSTAPAGAQVAVTVDDQRSGSADKTELSAKLDVVSDGQWHLYEWNLSGGGWSSFSNGNGTLDSAVVSLDAVMLYAPNQASDWTLYIDDVSRNAAGPLPVELNGFTAERRGDSVMLRWGTGGETDNYGFEVERQELVRRVSGPSDASADASPSQWSRLAFVPGNGTTAAPHEYVYVDHRPLRTGALYRLRQIDRDGRYRYTAAVNVDGGMLPARFAMEQNHPNPFNPSTTIRYTIPQEGNAALVVYDLLGREVARLADGPHTAGTYAATFDASRLASGVYLARLTSGRFSSVIKMSLMK